MRRTDPVRTANRRHFLRRLLAGSTALVLAGCDAAARSTWLPKILATGEKVTRGAQRLLTSKTSLAQEFTEADLSPTFRSNGTSNPRSEAYQQLAAGGFADYTLLVDGLVMKPATFTLAQLRALPARTQITRHDCVEGWSAIGKWTGVPLAYIVEAVQPTAEARFAVFHCADAMDARGTPYYESIDLEDAVHPQTLLAYELNGAALPVANGAPVRLRVERQLGYKHAKYVMRIEFVSEFAHLHGGQGGYWEDRGYEWYAGI